MKARDVKARVWRSPRARAGALMVVVALVLVLGSYGYWLAEGKPGTANDFRRQVADAGLTVTWSNVGPRGGSGLVDTACGPVGVTINDSEGARWVAWGDHRELITREAIDALLSCAR